MATIKINKKGKFSFSSVEKIIFGLIIIIALFTVYSSVVPSLQDAGDSMNASNRCLDLSGIYNGSTGNCQVVAGNLTNLVPGYNTTPLAGIFGGAGIVVLIVMASLVIIVVRSYLKKE